MPTITDVDSDDEGATTVQQSQYDDIDDMDYELPPVAAPSGASGSSSKSRQNPSSVNPFTASLASSFGGNQPNVITTDEAARFKHYQVVYPIYIDSQFAHKNGERRVSKAKAVKYPKAQEMAEVCGRVLGLAPVFEPEKTHPRDWQNPGRVRILIKDKASGRLLNPSIKDKYTLLQKLCDGIRLLRSHNPTDTSSILFKLPYHSPAISYGTLDEALKGGGKMQEMMKGMLGGAMPGAAGGAGSGGGAIASGQDEAEAKRKADERELAEKQKMAKLKALNKQGRRMGRR